MTSPRARAAAAASPLPGRPGSMKPRARRWWSGLVGWGRGWAERLSLSCPPRICPLSAPRLTASCHIRSSCPRRLWCFVTASNVFSACRSRGSRSRPGLCCCCGCCYCLLSIARLETSSGLVGRHGPLLLSHAISTHPSTSPLALLELALLWVAPSIVLLLLRMLLSHVPVHTLLVLLTTHHAFLTTHHSPMQRLARRCPSQVAVATMPRERPVDAVVPIQGPHWVRHSSTRSVLHGCVGRVVNGRKASTGHQVASH